MSETRNITTKIEVKGESEYKSAIKTVNSELKTLQSEMKRTESQFAGHLNSYEALSAKGATLEKMYAAQKEKLSTLREALAADGCFAGIPWVVVSMGAAGSVGFHEGRAFRAKTPAIAAVNATGSGDSTIAGFAHAIAAGADDVTVLKTANTCGKLNAMDPKTGHLVMDRWDEVYNSVVVTEL